MHTRIMIAEAMSDKTAIEVCNLFDVHIVDLDEPGFLEARRLSEESGRMVVLETTWTDLRFALAYHQSCSYRRLIVSIQHLVVGKEVTKLFRSVPYMRQGSELVTVNQ